LAVVIYYISIYFDLSLFTLYNTADGETGGARGAPPEKSGGLAPAKNFVFSGKIL
jgi:hypothetical protein